jgi:hypothetical protein
MSGIALNVISLHAPQLIAAKKFTPVTVLSSHDMPPYLAPELCSDVSDCGCVIRLE